MAVLTHKGQKGVFFIYCQNLENLHSGPLNFQINFSVLETNTCIITLVIDSICIQHIV